MPEICFSFLNFWSKYLGRREIHPLTDPWPVGLKLENREPIALTVLRKLRFLSTPEVALVLFQSPTMGLPS